MKNKYNVGDILKGKINNREFKILKVSTTHYEYQDLKTMNVFTVGIYMLEHCLVEKIN